MNPDLDKLLPYPFQRLAKLKEGCTPPSELEHIALSIGEPQHPSPHFVVEALLSHLHGLAKYPLTRGADSLRQAMCDWLTQRFKLNHQALDAEKNVLPVNGTREALFAIAQCVVDRSQSNPLVLMPNPFYQIYEGAALLAGATPWLMNTTAQSGFLPDINAVSAATWDDCQLIYVCTPGNPTGATMSLEQLQQLIQLADKHNFVIVSDECYSEIYHDEEQPPAGLLEAAHAIGNTHFKNCLVFHSLSKRSNLPGLRSGFVAGDSDIIEKFLSYRTYHGSAMPPATQAASTVAWRDERHVIANRKLYREKFNSVLNILDGDLEVTQPKAGFYLWPKVNGADTEFARRLYDEQNVTVLPGSFLSRESNGINPGAGYIRMALVAPLDECVDAANRIKILINR